MPIDRRGIKMITKNNVVHYTDFSFQKFCEDKYGVNRGVYNTIDRWFYEKGLVNILNRRLLVLEFLNYVANSRSHNKSKIRFGNGGLTNQLNEFFEKKRRENSLVV